jgi:hypothetical protein
VSERDKTGGDNYKWKSLCCFGEYGVGNAKDWFFPVFSGCRSEEGFASICYVELKFEIFPFEPAIPVREKNL